MAFNDDHALYFLEKRVGQGLEGSRLIGVQVDPVFLEKLRADAVPQQLAKKFPGMPQIADPKIGKDLYGIPAEYFDELQKAIKPGAGFKICP